MLKLHMAESYQPPSHICPMPSAVGHNFVSQLTGDSTAFDEHEGPLGIKCCFRGQEHYYVEGGRLVVDESAYLLLNQGQRYASAFQSRKTVESFCIWFRPGFAEQVLSSLCLPADRLLNEPQRLCSQPVAFFERLYPHDTLVSPLLFGIRQAIQQETLSRPWLEDQFHLLLERLLLVHRSLADEIARLPAIKATTRAELYRRLYRARDYLDASLDLSVSLPDVAGVACLAPHHFLRQFRHLFGETPHSYHRRRRLERAARLLTSTEQSVTEICYGLGFESLGSFSWLFSHNYGVAPREYRQQFAQRKLIRLCADKEVISPASGDHQSAELKIARPHRLP